MQIVTTRHTVLISSPISTCWIHPDKKIRFYKIKKCCLSGNRCGVLMLHCQWHCSLQFSLLHWLDIYIVPYPWQLLPKMIYNMIVTGLPVTYKYDDAIVFVVCRLKSKRLACWIRGQCLGTMSGCTTEWTLHCAASLQGILWQHVCCFVCLCGESAPNNGSNQEERWPCIRLRALFRLPFSLL